MNRFSINQLGDFNYCITDSLGNVVWLGMHENDAIERMHDLPKIIGKKLSLHAQSDRKFSVESSNQIQG